MSAIDECAGISVIIPTMGRPQVLSETLASIGLQSLRPRQIIIIASEPADLEMSVLEKMGAEIFFDVGSLARKRNLGLQAAKCPYIFFADDDMELRSDYLARAAALLDEFPSIVGFSGKLLKDGGISRDEARQKIAEWKEPVHWRGCLIGEGKFNQIYGCNMMYRRSLLMRETFDEELPGYSFGEDYDLWVRARRYGITGVYDKCIAIHLKSPGGRANPAKVAYSRLTNHWHFLQKGVSHVGWPFSHLRFIFASMKFPFRSVRGILRGEVNRSVQELRGYGLAMLHILGGRSHPSRISEIL